ncbi:sulfite exporter TauE/SafE family protein [Minwuia sp.]|uniref:sulfite exporter TauE/SafE family protein n=1 Tax=Minwuia sp. TaxID=2493630 RepID=UPI003A8FB6A2
MDDLIIPFAIFLIAGLVKGVVGFGLPTVCLVLFTLTSGLFDAMALLLVPSLVTNLWQAVRGGQFIALSRRLVLFYATASGGIFIGALALGHVDPDWLVLLLGLLTVTYGFSGLAGVRIRVPRHREGPMGALTGLTNGVLTGMTGSFVVPGVLYLQAIGLPREALVQAMGILFSLSTLALAIALGGNGLLSVDLGWQSALGVVPAVIGMTAGQRLRGHLSETAFRRAVLIGLSVLGCAIILRALTI